MKAELVKVREGDIKKLDKIAIRLLEGAVLVFPTDTVYGIGADGFNVQAAERIYKIKSRDRKKQLILMIGRKKDVYKLAENIPPQALKLIDKYWPGPLTLIMNASLPVRLVTGSTTVGIRMPGHRLLIELLKKFGRPLATTSANISGKKSCVSLAEAVKLFAGKVDLIMDCGQVKHKAESTVLDVSSFPFNILREGVIKKEELAKFV